jgi:hypothetical protein
MNIVVEIGSPIRRSFSMDAEEVAGGPPGVQGGSSSCPGRSMPPACGGGSIDTPATTSTRLPVRENAYFEIDKEKRSASQAAERGAALA